MGGVVDHILNAANEMQADLIVLGTDAAGAFWPIRGDGAAYEIIARASCPVLTLRHNAGTEDSKEHYKRGSTNMTSVYSSERSNRLPLNLRNRSPMRKEHRLEFDLGAGLLVIATHAISLSLLGGVEGRNCDGHHTWS